MGGGSTSHACQNHVSRGVFWELQDQRRGQKCTFIGNCSRGSDEMKVVLLLAETTSNSRGQQVNKGEYHRLPSWEWMSITPRRKFLISRKIVMARLRMEFSVKSVQMASGIRFWNQTALPWEYLALVSGLGLDIISGKDLDVTTISATPRPPRVEGTVRYRVWIYSPWSHSYCWDNIGDFDHLFHERGSSYHRILVPQPEHSNVAMQYLSKKRKTTKKMRIYSSAHDNYC